MANVCGRCKRPMSSHDDHASCPQCRIPAGECNLNFQDPCTICGVWTSKQWRKLRRSLVDARPRASQRERQHWTAAFPELEAWITSRPALSPSSSGPASEISSQAGEGDFNDSLVVSTTSPLVQQDLVVQTQNGVNMASGTATTAPCTAPLPLTAGPSTIEPIVPIVAPLVAQDTPSVIQGARPVVNTEQTMQSTQGYGTLPYVCCMRLLQGGQPVLRGLDLKTRPLTKLNAPGLLQHLTDPLLPRGTTLGGLAQPQGHLRPVLNGLSTRLLLPRTWKPSKLT